jgi:hypothetical protein
MKKNKMMVYSILAIAFALFNVVAFAIPTAKTATFWIAYAFTIVAFASHIVIFNFAFKDENNLKSNFLGIPLISVGIKYFTAQIIAFIVFMLLPTIPNWVAIVVCALILGISVIRLIGTKAAIKEINHIDKKVEKKVFYIRSLQIDVEMLASAEADENIKSSLTKLAEKIRFSDPMSNEALSGLEIEIADKVAELKTAENKEELIFAIDLLITERNKKAKILK